MNNFTTNTYEMKREIANFSKNLNEILNEPKLKIFSID